MARIRKLSPSAKMASPNPTFWFTISIFRIRPWRLCWREWSSPTFRNRSASSAPSSGQLRSNDVRSDRNCNCQVGSGNSGTIDLQRRYVDGGVGNCRFLIADCRFENGVAFNRQLEIENDLSFL